MTRRTAAVVLAAALLVVAASAVQPGCARRRPGGSPLEPGGVLAVVSAPEAGARANAATAPATRAAATQPMPPSGCDRLEAVRTVMLFCDLFGSRRNDQARALLGAPGVLRARELRGARELAFISARVKAHPRAGTLTVAASVRMSPRLESLPRAGVGTLFFTLGRVGTTTGGWLITAVTTSP